MFVLPLPLSLLPPGAKTNMQPYRSTPTPAPEKKTQKKKHHSTQETQEHKHSVLGRKETTAILSVFLPFFPTLIFLPHTTWINPEGFFSWDPGQRVKDTRCSRLTVLPALLHQSLMFRWGWAVGRRAQGWPHQSLCMSWCWKHCTEASRSLTCPRFDLSSQWLH